MDQLQQLKEENALLKKALFGKHGVVGGLNTIEKALATAVAAKHEDAPFPFDEKQAKAWHAAQQSAYQHALEMISVPSDVIALADAVTA